ncbi:MAG: N-acetylmuramoyl-L-alanine amidase [Dysosmobacter sp.]
MILLIRKRTLLYTWLTVCMIGLSAIFLAGSRRAFTPTGAMWAGEPRSNRGHRPGHGGQDGGAVAGDGTEESRINLAISLQLEQLLRFAGVRTELTRREDVMVCDPGLETMRQREGVGPPQPGVICQRRS